MVCVPAWGLKKLNVWHMKRQSTGQIKGIFNNFFLFKKLSKWNVEKIDVCIYCFWSTAVLVWFIFSTICFIYSMLQGLHLKEHWSPRDKNLWLCCVFVRYRNKVYKRKAVHYDLSQIWISGLVCLVHCSLFLSIPSSERCLPAWLQPG